MVDDSERLEVQSEDEAKQWYAAKSGLLPRVGGFVQRLRYLGPGWGFSDDWRLSSSVLAHLSPSALQSLQLEHAEVDAAAAEALQQFTGLTRLVADNFAISGLVAALPRLPQLQSLSLSCNEVPLGLPVALQQLTQLTYLSCSADKPLPDLSTLLPLTRLRELGWAERRRAGSLQVDVQQLLARLVQLEGWSISSELNPNRQTGMQVMQAPFEGGDGMQSALTTKRCSVALSLRRGCTCLLCSNPATLQIGGAMIDRCTVRGFSPASGVVQNLHFTAVGWSRMHSLQQLVAAALPAGTQHSQLRSLSVDYSALRLPAVRDCAFLGHLTSLALSTCNFPDASATAGIEALLQQAPRLQKLTLRQCLGRQPFPPALLSRKGLRHLSLKGNGMSKLPADPYLEGESALFDCPCT